MRRERTREIVVTLIKAGRRDLATAFVRRDATAHINELHILRDKMMRSSSPEARALADAFYDWDGWDPKVVKAYLEDIKKWGDTVLKTIKQGGDLQKTLMDARRSAPGGGYIYFELYKSWAPEKIAASIPKLKKWCDALLKELARPFGSSDSGAPD